MAYRILPTKEFSRDFRKLDHSIRLRIKSKFEETADDPERYKKLHYDLKRSCRLRIGKLRVIFSYDKKKKELYLEKIVLKHKYKK